MSFSGIAQYCLRALYLALPATLLLYGLRLVRGKRGTRRRELTVLLFYFYMSSLLAITAIRGGEHLLDFWRQPHSPDSVQWIPIRVTLRQARAGLWAIVYPVAGNILWFVPFGFLLTRLRPRWGVFAAAGLSLLLSCTIEILQYVLLSGVSDIDDVIFNVTGGILGDLLGRLIRRRR